MLLNLPFEILLNVVRILSHDDKVNVCITCHKLHAMISENCLYETLNIKNQHMTKHIITKFKNKELNGSQVKYLKISIDVLSDKLYCELPIIFPNVIRLQNHADNEGPRDHYTLRKMLKWKDTLQYYDTRDNTYKIGRLLERNTFSKLKHAHLSTFFFLDLNMYKTDLRLLECVAHAPLLETLELYLCEVNIKFLEKVHESCPFLKTLSLKRTLLSAINDKLPRKIEPATKLLNLQIDSESCFCDEECLFLKYIIKKYPNLQVLELFPSFQIDNIGDLLQGLHLVVDINNTRNNPIYSLFVNSHNDTQETYQEDGIQFTSKLPKTLTTIKLHSTIFYDIIKGLKQADLNLSTFEIHEDELWYPGLNALDDDEDMLFFPTQTSLKTIKVAMDPAIRFHSPEIISTSITKLDLIMPFASPCNTMCIGWILTAFPSLEILNIHSEDGLFFETDIDKLEKNYNMRELNITYGFTNPSLLIDIPTIAPNIKKLSFNLVEIKDDMIMVEKKRHLYNYPKTFNKKYGTGSYVVDVCNFHLDTFRLNCEFGINTEDGGPVDIYFEIIHNSQVKRLIVSSCRNYVTVVKDEKSHRLKKRTKVSVLCDKINELILVGSISITFKDGNISFHL